MNQDDKEKLWLEFSKKPSVELREKIIIEYAGLVKIVAGKLSMYLGYNVEYDDLIETNDWEILLQTLKFMDRPTVVEEDEKSSNFIYEFPTIFKNKQ